ncbi:MAG TPA: elongation factor P [Desulfurobacteriaceae bacterium]|nr:elongation factor P [Desulfurobacteriaceae bacterium]
MASIDVNQISKGMKLEIDGEPYEIIDYEHVKPGKGQAFARIKLKNLVTGNVIEKTYKVGEKLNLADFEEREMQYIYNDGDFYYFMDKKTYDQVGVPAHSIEDKVKFLKEEMVCYVQFYKGQPINIKLPKTVVLEVIDTEPGHKGDTVTNVTKPAKVETGAIIQVPLFINVGDKIKIDTETGQYLERVNK